MSQTAWPRGGLPIRMSYEEYQALPDEIRAEWVDGEVVVTPSLTPEHQQAARRIANLLENGLTGVYVVEAVTVRLPLRERIPDVSVVTAWPQDTVIADTPTASVEVTGHGVVVIDLDAVFRRQ